MIKRLFTACAVTIAALAFFSCKPGEDSASISVSESRLDFSADGETLSFIIETSDQNMTWTITTDGQDWYTVSPESGTGNARVEVTAEVYLESTTREALLTVSADGASDQEIRIQQLTPVDPTMVTFYSLTEAEQESIGMINSRVTAVSGNGKWAVAVDEDMGYQAMLWSYETREFMDLNDGSQSTCNASDVSNDGMIVGGSGYYSDGVWSDLPDGNPRFISDDGHVVGGTSAGEPTIWIDFVKQPPLENLPPEEDRGQFGLMMLGMSEDGSVICGKTEWPNGMVSPAVHANGTLTRIYGESMEAEYFYFGEATAVSKDGTKVVGYFQEDGVSVSNNFVYDVPTGTLTEIDVPLPACVGYDGTIYGQGSMRTPAGETVSYYDYIDQFVTGESNVDFQYPYIVFSVSDNGKVWGGYYTITEGTGVTYMIPGIWVFE